MPLISFLDELDTGFVGRAREHEIVETVALTFVLPSNLVHEELGAFIREAESTRSESNMHLGIREIPTEKLMLDVRQVLRGETKHRRSELVLSGHVYSDIDGCEVGCEGEGNIADGHVLRVGVEGFEISDDGEVDLGERGVEVGGEDGREVGGHDW